MWQCNDVINWSFDQLKIGHNIVYNVIRLVTHCIVANLLISITNFQLVWHRLLPTLMVHFDQSLIDHNRCIDLQNTVGLSTVWPIKDWLERRKSHDKLTLFVKCCCLLSIEDWLGSAKASYLRINNWRNVNWLIGITLLCYQSKIGSRNNYRFLEHFTLFTMYLLFLWLIYQQCWERHLN